MRAAPVIQLSADEKQKLTQLSCSNTASMLLAANGLRDQEIAAQLGIGRMQVSRWRERYAQGGLAAIERDLPRGGRRPKVDTADIVRRTIQTGAGFLRVRHLASFIVAAE